MNNEYPRQRSWQGLGDAMDVSIFGMIGSPVYKLVSKGFQYLWELPKNSDGWPEMSQIEVKGNHWG